MFEILKELINVMINDPVMCVILSLCFGVLLICCVAGCVIMLLDSFYESVHKKKARKKKAEKEKIK